MISLILSFDGILAGRAAADGIYHFVYGTILDNLGNPVVGLLVTGDDYVGDDLPSSVTDTNGFYQIDAGTEGSYRFNLDCSYLAAHGLRCVGEHGVSVAGEFTEVDYNLEANLEVHPLQITTGNLPSGNVTMPYNLQLGATNGQPPYTWQLATNSPALPPGLSLNSSGVISGTPKTNNVTAFKVVVTDANSAATNKVLFLTVNRQPMLLTPAWKTNRFSMRLFGAVSQNYTVQTATNANSTNWISLFITNNPNSASFIVTDPNATNKQRFYRVLIGP